MLKCMKKANKTTNKIKLICFIFEMAILTWMMIMRKYYTQHITCINTGIRKSLNLQCCGLVLSHLSFLQLNLANENTD